MLSFEGEKGLALERWYRSAEVVAQREFVLNHAAVQPGEQVLDLGVGPGFLTESLATAVGDSGAVYGIDISPSMVSMSQARCATQPHVHIAEGNACSLTSCHPAGSFDCLISTQVYEYVPDMELALQQAALMLRPGGRLLIVDTDFSSVVWYSADPERMRRVLLAYDEHLAHPHLPQSLRPLLVAAGFQVQPVQVFPICSTELQDGSYSFGLLTTIAEFVVGRQGITAVEAAAWRAEQEALHSQGEYFFSLNRYLFLARKKLE